jgi:hypothetical protein
MAHFRYCRRTDGGPAVVGCQGKLCRRETRRSTQREKKSHREMMWFVRVVTVTSAALDWTLGVGLLLDYWPTNPSALRTLSGERGPQHRGAVPRDVAPLGPTGVTTRYPARHQHRHWTTPMTIGRIVAWRRTQLNTIWLSTSCRASGRWWRLRPMMVSSQQPAVLGFTWWTNTRPHGAKTCWNKMVRSKHQVPPRSPTYLTLDVGPTLVRGHVIVLTRPRAVQNKRRKGQHLLSPMSQLAARCDLSPCLHTLGRMCFVHNIQAG